MPGDRTQRREADPLSNAQTKSCLSAIDRNLDNRHETRLEWKGRAVYHWDDGDGEPLPVTDVSFGGFSTQTKKFFPPERVMIDLPILGERRVQICWDTTQFIAIVGTDRDHSKAAESVYQSRL